MQNPTNLNSISEGETARVTDILLNDNMRRRLMDLGVVEGTLIQCVQKSIFGDPIAYLIRGATIALRSEDSSNILVSLI